jgi:hypothetical protein
MSSASGSSIPNPPYLHVPIVRVPIASTQPGLGRWNRLLATSSYPCLILTAHMYVLHTFHTRQWFMQPADDLMLGLLCIRAGRGTDG